MAIISKEEFEKIEQIKGEILGVALKGKLHFVLEKKGKKGLKKVEKELEKLGYPLKFKDLKSFQWYPEKLDYLLIVTIKNIFNFDDEIIHEMGRFNAKVSLVAKIMMRYFVSVERVAQEVGNYWARYRTVGKLETEEVNEKERYLILVLKDFTGHPVYCRYLKGYFWQIASYVVPKEKLEVKEIECVFKGNKVHKFKFSW